MTSTTNGTLRGPAIRDYIEDRLECARRWAQTLVSSWSSEGWMQRDAQQRIETLQTSLDHRLGLYTAHREESPRENGRLGGRPKKQSEGFHASRDVQQVFDR